MCHFRVAWIPSSPTPRRGLEFPPRLLAFTQLPARPLEHYCSRYLRSLAPALSARQLRLVGRTLVIARLQRFQLPPQVFLLCQRVSTSRLPQPRLLVRSILWSPSLRLMTGSQQRRLLSTRPVATSQARFCWRLLPTSLPVVCLQTWQQLLLPLQACRVDFMSVTPPWVSSPCSRVALAFPPHLKWCRTRPVCSLDQLIRSLRSRHHMMVRPQKR